MSAANSIYAKSYVNICFSRTAHCDLSIELSKIFWNTVKLMTSNTRCECVLFSLQRKILLPGKLGRAVRNGGKSMAIIFFLNPFSPEWNTWTRARTHTNARIEWNSTYTHTHTCPNNKTNWLRLHAYAGTRVHVLLHVVLSLKMSERKAFSFSHIQDEIILPSVLS